MPAFIDITGQRFGRLVAVRTDGYYRKQIKWLFQCDCGGQISRISYDVRSGGVASCGCARARCGEEPRGPGWQPRRKQRLYKIWCAMKRRCHSPTSDGYAYYGARGVSVCTEWRGDYSAFRTWALENGYRDDLEIDRIDVDGGYGPGNCRWVDRITNMNNRRRTRRVLLDGKAVPFADAARQLGVCRKTVANRVASGTLQEA